MKLNAINETNEIYDANFETEEMPSNVLDFSSTLRELGKSVDPNLVRRRVGGTDRFGKVHMVDYVEWHTVADILDRNAPNWGHTIKDIRPIGDILTMTVAITIDGVTREGVGTGRIDTETGIKKAEHDALKRAAVKFGIARELYKREFETIEQEEQGPNGSPRKPENPVAKSLGDLVTAKQLGMIRALGRDFNVDVEKECANVMSCNTDELSKRAASDFIEHLQSLQREAVPMRRAS